MGQKRDKEMVWRVFQLLLFPSSFADYSVKHDVKESTDKEEYLKEVKKRIRKKRIGFLISFIVVSFIVIFGFGAAKITNQCISLPDGVILIARVLSISIVAWSVLSRLGYESETWKRESILEKTSMFSFKFFYSLGLFLTVWSLLIQSGGSA